MTRSFTLRQRLRYRFDNTLSKGLWAVMLWLAAVLFGFVLLVAVIIRLSGIGPDDQETNFFDGLWLAVTHSLDTGSFAGDSGAHFRLLGLTVTVAGIFVAATVIVLWRRSGHTD